MLVDLLVVPHFRHQLLAEAFVPDGIEARVEVQFAQPAPGGCPEEVVGGQTADSTTASRHRDARDVETLGAHGADALVQDFSLFADGAEQDTAGARLFLEQVHLFVDPAEVRHRLHEAAFPATARAIATSSSREAKVPGIGRRSGSVWPG